MRGADWLPRETSNVTSLRDRTVGAGYDYQWEVVAYFLLRFVLRPADALQSEIRDALTWLGPVESVTFEGSGTDGELEDFNFKSEDRELLIQVKETDEDVTQGLWRPTTTNFEKFMTRIGRRTPSSSRRILFVTNGSFHADVRKLLEDDDRQAALHQKVYSGEASPPTEQDAKQNWKQVRVTSFLNATPVDQDVASDGVGAANVNRLDALGVSDPRAAYPRLVREIQRSSFRLGGTTMRSQRVREQLRNVLALPLRSPGSLLGTLRSRLVDVPHDLPSAETFERGGSGSTMHV